MNGQEERMVRRPFSSIPDIEAYYPLASAETAHRRIYRTLDRGEGIALLFGDAGLGKTLALRLLAGKFELDAPVLLFSNAHIANRRSFYLDLLFQLRCDFTSSDEDELRVRFFEHLRHSDYPYYVFLFDNADTLPLSVFDEVRSLLDIESRGGPRFRAAFAGTSRFEERLNAPRFARFSQRIVSRSWLEPFARDETKGYIDRQLKRAADELNGLTFSADAAKQVHKFADGVPRVINQICDLALYLNEGSESVISEKIIRKAWGLLQQIPDEEDSSADLRPESASSPSEVYFPPEETESSSVVEFGELDSDSDGLLFRSPGQKEEEPKDGDASDGVVEFGSLDDDPLAPPANSAPISETSRDKDVIRFVPKKTLPEAEETIVPSGRTDADDGEADESISIDDRSIDWHESAERNSVADDAERWEEDDEIIDETGADLTYDSMIREKLLNEFPEENNAGTAESACTVENIDGGDLDEETDRCMEELRLMEMEVSRAGNVICKIRKMQTGLDSFEKNDEGTVCSDSAPEGDEEPAPAKKRSFHNVFEKLYHKEGDEK